MLEFELLQEQVARFSEAYLLYEEYWGQSLLARGLLPETRFHTGFSYFLLLVRVKYQEVSPGYFCKFALFGFTSSKGPQKLMLRMCAYALTTLFRVL